MGEWVEHMILIPPLYINLFIAMKSHITYLFQNKISVEPLTLPGNREICRIPLTTFLGGVIFLILGLS